MPIDHLGIAVLRCDWQGIVQPIIAPEPRQFLIRPYVFFHHNALGRDVAHGLDTCSTQGLDLLDRGDPKTVGGKRMAYPVHGELDKHAHAELFNIDQDGFSHGQGGRACAVPVSPTVTNYHHLKAVLHATPQMSISVSSEVVQRNQLTHQGAGWLWTTSIQRAIPPSRHRIRPARRDPKESRSPSNRLRSHCQRSGPPTSHAPLARPNKSMHSAPRAALPLSAAVSNAVYSRPQGRSAHAMPVMNKPPGRATNGCTRFHTARPACSIQAGCRACNTIIRPHAITNTCVNVHRGLMAVLC